MAFVNYNNKEITVKIVYYGPALSGKTTCLQYTYNSKEYKKKGKLITLDTDGDRTLFFDFLPIEIGKLGDYSIKMQLYTVPGQVAYDTTRKLVLQGSDGVVFVADSQVVMREQNISSLKNLKENLKANKISFAEIPLILQYNKRDLREILPVDVLNRDLNPDNKPFFATVGTTGDNVLEALHTIMKMVIIYLKNKLTVFQKDKTVMFTREEATDTIIAPRAAGTAVKPPMTKEKMMPDRANEDTEKEELFELSTPMPMEEESLKTNDYQPGLPEQDEEIFNLGDDSMMGSDDDSLEIPEANLRDELGEIREEPKRRIFEAKLAPAPPIQTPDIDMKIKQRPEMFGQPSAAVDKIIEVPLNIQIPEDKDEIKINLNLQIVIKRQ
ncbi:MAG: hypothetical protein QG657_121 [Acidobacteriota bacterium]|nr:hypothetical protein [Acidobacteriota bacterium]